MFNSADIAPTTIKSETRTLTPLTALTHRGNQLAPLQIAVSGAAALTVSNTAAPVMPGSPSFVFESNTPQAQTGASAAQPPPGAPASDTNRVIESPFQIVATLPTLWGLAITAVLGGQVRAMLCSVV